MSKGLTLVELVILVAIISALGAGGWYLLNPVELRARENDSLRLADLALLSQAINQSTKTASASAAISLCGGKDSCSGESNITSDSYRKPNGEGWVKVDLTTQKSSLLPTLPIDPVNSDKLFYSFKSDGVGWEINAVFESSMYKVKMESDGGDNDNKYEVGTNLTLIN
jgi:hypothetical protein